VTFAPTRPFLKASRKFAHHLRNCRDCGKGPLNTTRTGGLCHTGSFLYRRMVNLDPKKNELMAVSTLIPA
jgi:hypothetical protein